MHKVPEKKKNKHGLPHWMIAWYYFYKNQSRTKFDFFWPPQKIINLQKQKPLNVKTDVYKTIKYNIWHKMRAQVFTPLKANDLVQKRLNQLVLVVLTDL